MIAVEEEEEPVIDIEYVEQEGSNDGEEAL